LVEFLEGFGPVGIVDRFAGVQFYSFGVHVVGALKISLGVELIPKFFKMGATLRFLLILVLIKLILILILISRILLVIVILLHIRRRLLLVLKIIICLILILILKVLLSKYLRKIFKILHEIFGVKRHVRLIIYVNIVICGVLLEIYIRILLGVLRVLFCCMHGLVDCTEDPVHEIGRDLLIILILIVLS
jgi:hypothetical protein